MADNSFTLYILDQLSDIPDVDAKAMFGGFGLYAGSTFFGIIHEGRLYFKTDEKTREQYIKESMEPFQPSAKQTLKNYYEVPPDLLDDANKLTEWAQRAIHTAKEA